MSQVSIEQVLGRLICDDAFRNDFYGAPERTLRQLGLQLTRVELNALRTVERDLIELLAQRLDDRIRRAPVISPGRNFS